VPDFRPVCLESSYPYRQVRGGRNMTASNSRVSAELFGFRGIRTISTYVELTVNAHWEYLHRTDSCVHLAGDIRCRDSFIRILRVRISWSRTTAKESFPHQVKNGLAVLSKDP
jgi:hypothetical protein